MEMEFLIMFKIIVVFFRLLPSCFKILSSFWAGFYKIRTNGKDKSYAKYCVRKEKVFLTELLESG